MSEIALVDDEEIFNRAFESSQHQPEYFDQSCTLRQQKVDQPGATTIGILDPKLCPPRITRILHNTSMTDHDEPSSFYKSKQMFADGLLLLVIVFHHYIFILNKHYVKTNLFGN